MSEALPRQFRQIQSNITSDGQLEVSLGSAAMPELRPDDVLIRVEATPINPSDLGLLIGPADLSTARNLGTEDSPRVVADLPPQIVSQLATRVDKPMPVGNEGAGTVVAAGESPDAQALLGRVVSVANGAMYAEYRKVRASHCLVLEAGTTAEEAASCFVNPMTALAMVETMRLENHIALVHTAAASNLGQMLVKICLADDIELVNVVRREEHVALLKALGATHVVNSTSENFEADLADALAETGATIAFDATGGGSLGGQILAAMEVAASRNATEFSRYGSATFKQLYIYGGLDTTPTTFRRNFGMSWSMGGWLLRPFLERVGPEVAEAMRQRIAREIRTTFVSQYSDKVSLAGALSIDAMRAYHAKATGRKFLICPQQ